MAELESIPLTNTVTVTNNGQTYSIINDKNGEKKIVEEIGMLSTKELVLLEFKKIREDSYLKRYFDSLSPDEQQQYLTNIVINNYKKTHFLKNGAEQSKPQNRAENATRIIANKKLDDAYSNQELGIIESNGVITTVEEQFDGTINVNEVDNRNNDSINVSGSTDNSYTSDSSSSIDSDSMTSDTYLNSDGSEIINEVTTDSQTLSTENNKVSQEQSMQNSEASLSHSQQSTRFVRTLRPQYMQPNQRFRANRPNGFIENSIIISILMLSTVLGLIIGSIMALYK